MRWYYPPIYEMELSIEKSDKLKNIPLYYKIYPDSIDFLHTGSYERWEIFDICSVNEIYVFFIADSIMQKEGWNNIVKKQLYTKKESFTMEQLEKQRWIIEYP
ncbi:hypothetical protein [Dysgonomonas sp. 216]|uniref:hypothetical protein n=1 Tax=Dysgonomonas sp. 216 TaxID=2302934 RepID=UPI0013D4C5E0|nr:hypothetical protein [Dysgonomonas sp. 216]